VCAGSVWWVPTVLAAWPSPGGDSGPDGFAADDPLQTHVPHQSRHCATGNIEAFTLELPPDLAHAVDAEVLIEDAPDLDLQRSILSGARGEPGGIPPLGRMGVIARGGDPQNLADRLDPMRPTMIVDESDHGLDRRSSSAIAK
jgi:hypothetical protein